MSIWLIIAAVAFSILSVLRKKLSCWADNVSQRSIFHIKHSCDQWQWTCTGPWLLNWFFARTNFYHQTSTVWSKFSRLELQKGSVWQREIAWDFKIKPLKSLKLFTCALKWMAFFFSCLHSFTGKLRVDKGK